MINELANVLDTTATYLLGYKIEIVKPDITTFADVAVMLFEFKKVTGLKFDVDVKRPPRDNNRECSLKFEGKAKTDLNADMCLFLEDWKDKTLVLFKIAGVNGNSNGCISGVIRKIG